MTSEPISPDDIEYEQTALATAQLERWDSKALEGRRAAAMALAMVWASLGGQTFFPLGLLIALGLLLPSVPGWGLVRRVRFVGRRVWWLVGMAVVGLTVVRPRLAFFTTAENIFSLSLDTWLSLLP